MEASLNKRRASADASTSRSLGEGMGDMTPHPTRKARKTKEGDGPGSEPSLRHEQQQQQQQEEQEQEQEQQQHAGPSHGRVHAGAAANVGPSSSTAQKKGKGRRKKGGEPSAQATQGVGLGEAGPSGQAGGLQQQQQEDQQEPEQDEGVADKTPEERLRIAVDRLTRLLCDDDSRRYFAEHALQKVLEQRPGVDTNVLEWVEEAQVWVACNNETEQEIIQLRDAMAVSLAEEELRRAEQAKATPAADELLAKYAATQVLKQLSGVVCARVLAGDACQAEGVWKALCKLLDHEAKCCKWYPCPGARYFFQQLGCELAQKLRELVAPALASAAASATGAAAAARGAAEAGPSGTGAGAGERAGGSLPCNQSVLVRCGGAAGGSACSCHAGSEATATTADSAQALQGCWQQLKKLLDDKDAQIAQGLAELPPKHVEQLGWVPSLFRLPDNAPVGAGVELALGGDTKDDCIELLD